MRRGSWALPTAQSSLGRLVDQILDIGAGIEVGVAATKTFLGQLLAFYGLALASAERCGGCVTGYGPDSSASWRLACGLCRSNCES